MLLMPTRTDGPCSIQAGDGKHDELLVTNRHREALVAEFDNGGTIQVERNSAAGERVTHPTGTGTR